MQLSTVDCRQKNGINRWKMVKLNDNSILLEICTGRKKHLDENPESIPNSTGDYTKIIL